MFRAQRATCLIRGHNWEEHTDPAGTLTVCARCGALRHVRDRARPSDHDLHYKSGTSGGSSN